MITYIVLNGPTASGKSLIAKELCRKLNFGTASLHAITDSFAKPFKEFVASVLDEKYQRLDKDRLRAELSGESVREFLYGLTRYAKDVYGDDILGKWLVHRSLKNPHRLPKYYIVDDAKHPEDVMAIPKPFIVHVDRGGTKFKSGAYLEGSLFTFDNNDQLPRLWSEVDRLHGAVIKYAEANN